MVTMIQNTVCLILLLCAYVHAVSYPSSGRSCQIGWTASTDRCYLFGGISIRSWQSCQSYCSSMGARMPCIMSGTDVNFIRDRYPLQNSFYTGLNRLPGPWVWDSGSVGGCPSGYSNWAGGEPNGFATGEQCVEQYSSGQWNDISCGQGDGCVCEDNQEVIAQPCPIGWTLAADGQTCYYLNNAVTTWDSCNSFCAAQDPSATMLCVKSAAEQNFIWNMRTSRNTWVGYRKFGGVFRWPTGCTSTYTNFYPGEPNGGSDYAAYMWADTNGYWDDMPPGNGATCACQMPLGGVPPTKAPTKMPTAMPTIQPTVNYPDGLLLSRTYKVSNGFSFAALAYDGSVHTWGEAEAGGDSSAVQASISSGVSALVPSRHAYSALRYDGSVAPWGVSSHYANQVPRGPIVSVVASEAAFAGVTTTGAVMAYGAEQSGGNVLDNSKCNGFATQLSSGVQSIIASSASFTALKTDGTVFTWGDAFCGGGVSSLSMTALQQVRQVVATSAAFAARLQSGRVLTWGGDYAGGDSTVVTSKLSSGVVHMVASKSVFAAFKSDSSLVVWGHPAYGGAPSSSVISRLSKGVVFVAHTFSAMAVVHANGTVTAWGAPATGGDASLVQNRLQNVATIVGNGYAFAALTYLGGVITWGKPECGGVIPTEKVNALSVGVTDVYRTERAFAALKIDGSVVVWGQAGHGGNPGAAVEAKLIYGVHSICANDAAFSAIRYDGTVVAWGHPAVVPSPGVVLTNYKLSQPVTCA